MAGIERIVDEVLADHALAGCAVGIVTREGLGETALRGIARRGRSIDHDTVFRIGSALRRSSHRTNPRRVTAIAGAAAGAVVVVRRRRPTR